MTANEAIREAEVFDPTQHEQQLERILRVAASAPKPASWAVYERFKQRIRRLELEADDHERAINRLADILEI